MRNLLFHSSFPILNILFQSKKKMPLLTSFYCAWRESNPQRRSRSPMFYPLNYSRIYSFICFTNSLFIIADKSVNFKRFLRIQIFLKMSTLKSTFFSIFIVLPFCTICHAFYCVFSLLQCAPVRLPFLPASLPCLVSLLRKLLYLFLE